MTTHRIRLSLAVAAALAAAAFVFAGVSRAARADGIAVKSGDSIAFLGDSITANGWNHKAGYVHLVISGLQVNGVDATPIPAGISGNTSKDMIARLDRDILTKKPTWMTLSCGVNDVWHGANGVPLDQYKVNITSIVDQAQAAGIKVMILTSTPIGEDLNNSNNQKLVPYNQFLRQLAAEKHCLFADLNTDMRNALKDKTGQGNYLTKDGVHPIPRGDEVMATGILAAFGLSTEQIAKAKAVWQAIPDGWPIDVSYADPNGQKDARNRPAHELRASIPLTIAQHEALDKTAAASGKTAQDIANDLFAEDVKAQLKPTGSYDSVDAIFEAGQQDTVQKALSDQIRQQVGEG